MDNRRLGELLSGAARREQEAFTQLYREFYPAVYGIALSVLGQEADSADAAQEVFLRLWTLPPERFPRENPGAWLYTVARRAALKRRRGQPPALPLEELPSLPDPAPGPEAALDQESFRQLIAPLDGVSRQIVTLKLKAGFTHREIASLLGLNPATVRWKYAKAVHALRLFWGDLLGALAFLLLAIRSFPFREPTAGGPGEGSAPAPSPVPQAGWLPWGLLPLLALLLAAAAAFFGLQLWKRRSPKK